MKSSTPAKILGLVAAALACVSCAAMAPIGFASDRDANSFLGVKFGRPIAEARTLHPFGSVETSPQGADAYRMTDVASGSARYESVVYEFTRDHGMQLVVARFTSDSRIPIFDELRRKFGPPRNLTTPVDITDAAWNASSGVRIVFDGMARRLVLIGPYGRALEGDVALREQIQE